MEDSGREKLQAEQAKNGAVDAKEMKFDSASIKKKQGEEHFTNVEGAEARARAAEKARLEAEKAREKAEEQAKKEQKKADDAYVKSFVESQDKLEKEQKKADKKAQKEADRLEETPNQRKAKRKKTLIIAVAVAVLVISGVFGLIIFSKSNHASLSQEEYFLKVSALRTKINDIMDEHKVDSYDRAIAEYETTIESTKDTIEKFYYETSLIQFLMENSASSDDCRKIIEEIDDSSLRDEDKEWLNAIKCSYSNIYNSENYAIFCKEQSNE